VLDRWRLAPGEFGRIDDRHEELGAEYLLGVFGPAVAEPVRLHVAAKRYLCATDPGYFGCLSAASVRSLELQGGPFNANEGAAFRSIPFAEQAVRIRLWDVFAGFVQQLTDIVQQRGRDDRHGHSFALGEKGALQRVFALRDPLSPVLPGAPRCEQPQQPIHDPIHRALSPEAGIDRSQTIP
jgi:hypothetical protein